MPTPPNRIGTRAGAILAQYLALALTWGMSFLFIKIGLEGLVPGQVVLARMALGTITLAVVVAIRRQHLPRDPAVWGHLAVVGLLLCVLPFLLFSWAELRIPSGLASVLNATTPLMTILVSSVALRTERLGLARAVGLVVGFAGVIIVFVPWGGDAAGVLLGGDLLAKGACLAAALCYGMAFTWLRRFVAPRGLPAIPTAFVQVGLGTLMLLPLTPWLAAAPFTLTPRVVGSMLGLGVLGTGLAYIWNTTVVNNWGAVRASTVTYLVPLVGVVAGAVVLGERVAASSIVGGLAIITGVVTGNDGWKPLLRVLRRAGGASPRPADALAFDDRKPGVGGARELPGAVPVED